MLHVTFHLKPASTCAYQWINVDKFVFLLHGFLSFPKDRDNQSFMVEFYLLEHSGVKF